MNARAQLALCRVLAALGAGVPQRDPERGLAFSWPEARLGIAFAGEGPAPGTDEEGWSVVVVDEQQLVVLEQLLPPLAALAEEERRTRLGEKTDQGAPAPSAPPAPAPAVTPPASTVADESIPAPGAVADAEVATDAGDDTAELHANLLAAFTECGVPAPTRDMPVPGHGTSDFAWKELRGWEVMVCLEVEPSRARQDSLGTIRNQAAARAARAREEERREQAEARREVLRRTGWHVEVCYADELAESWQAETVALAMRTTIGSRLQALNAQKEGQDAA